MKVESCVRNVCANYCLIETKHEMMIKNELRGAKWLECFNVFNNLDTIKYIEKI